MILENGYVSFFSGGAEPTVSGGLPVAGKTAGSWSALIPCQWRVLTKNFQGLSTSRQAETVSSYEILISDGDSWSEKVRLYDAGQTLLGEYPAISSEHLHVLGIRRIIV